MIIKNDKYEFSVIADTDVEKARYMNLEGETKYIDTIRELIPGMGFFDIGTCMGLHSLCTMKLAKWIVAVEPDPENFKKMLSSIRRNAGNNVQCVQVAVTDQLSSSHTALFTDESRSNSPTTISREGTTRIIVPSITFSNLVKRYGLPDIVKIDIEGDEASIIHDVIEQAPKYICVEIHPQMLFRRGKVVGDVILPLERYYSLIHEFEHRDQSNQIWEIL